MRLIDADKIEWEYKCISREEIDEQPTIRAIPIDVIEKELKRIENDEKWAWYYGNVALDKLEYLKLWLTLKLEEWTQNE